MRQRTIRTWTAICMWTTALSGCAAGDGGGTAGPVDLRFELPDGEQQFRAQYQQDVRVDMGDHAMEAGRRYGARYTITRIASEDGRQEGSVRLDSLGIAITTAQGRQAFDTRHLIGDEFTLSVEELGGAPEYAGEVPMLDLGPMLGGKVGPALLMDYGFPRLPDHPVSVGDTWEATGTRTRLEGVLAVGAYLTAAYTFAGWETVGGVDCVRIEARIAGDLSGRGEQKEIAFDYAGTLQGTATWFLDSGTGSLIEMISEESTEGLMTSEDIRAPVEQRTTVQVRAITGS